MKMINRSSIKLHGLIVAGYFLLALSQEQVAGQESLSCFRQWGVGYCYRAGPDYPHDKVAENIANFRDVTKKMYGPDTTVSGFKVIKNPEKEVAIETPDILLKKADASTPGILNKYKPDNLPTHIPKSFKNPVTTPPRYGRKAQRDQISAPFLGYLPPLSHKKQSRSGDLFTAPNTQNPRTSGGGPNFNSREANYSGPFTPVNTPQRIKENSRTVKWMNFDEFGRLKRTDHPLKRTKRDLPDPSAEDDDLENCCPGEKTFHMPPWIQNVDGKWRLIVDMEPFVPRIQTVRCLHNTTRNCRDGCKCKQHMTRYMLLALDPDNDCAGIFNDLFSLPSECVCNCPKSRD